MKEKNMSQKYDGKIWVKNVKIIFFLNATKKMWDKNVGLKKCETKNVSKKSESKYEIKLSTKMWVNNDKLKK